MAIANTRMTLGTVLGTVATVANTTTNALLVITDGVEMLGNTVRNMKEEQKTKLVLDLANFRISYEQEAAQALTEKLAAIADYRNKSAAHAALFDSSLAAMKAEVLKIQSENKS